MMKVAPLKHRMVQSIEGERGIGSGHWGFGVGSANDWMVGRWSIWGMVVWWMTKLPYGSAAVVGQMRKTAKEIWNLLDVRAIHT